MPISTYLSAPPTFSTKGFANFQSYLHCREHWKIAKTIGGEGRRFAEKYKVCANWRLGVALNQPEEGKKARDIEEVKEGAYKYLGEPGRIFKVIFQGLFFEKKFLDMF